MLLHNHLFGGGHNNAGMHNSFELNQRSLKHSVQGPLKLHSLDIVFLPPRVKFERTLYHNTIIPLYHGHLATRSQLRQWFHWLVSKIKTTLGTTSSECLSCECASSFLKACKVHTRPCIHKQAPGRLLAHKAHNKGTAGSASSVTSRTITQP